MPTGIKWNYYRFMRRYSYPEIICLSGNSVIPSSVSCASACSATSSANKKETIMTMISVKARAA